MTKENARILIVDDDAVCVMAIKRAIKKMNFDNEVDVATDGVEALELIYKETEKLNSLPPYLILLDVNMPRMDGHEFLEILRNDPKLKKLVVFMLTTSEDEGDIQRAYGKNVAGYITKKSPLDTFTQTFKMIETITDLIVLPK